MLALLLTSGCENDFWAMETQQSVFRSPGHPCRSGEPAFILWAAPKWRVMVFPPTLAAPPLPLGNKFGCKRNGFSLWPISISEAEDERSCQDGAGSVWRRQ